MNSNQKDQIEVLISTIVQATQFLMGEKENDALSKSIFLVDDILAAVGVINHTLAEGGLQQFPVEALTAKAESLKVDEDLFVSFVEYLSILLESIHITVQNVTANRVTSGINRVDQSFSEMLQFIKNNEQKYIVTAIKKNLKAVKEKDRSYYNQVKACYNAYKYWGSLDPENGDYTLVTNRAEVLKAHVDDFAWLYSRLSDYRSKKTLAGILENWISFTSSSLEGIIDNGFKHYFDLDIIQCDKNEVMVDLGAFIGDTVADYTQSYCSFKKIFCYEIDDQNFKSLEKLTENDPNIELRKKGASDQAGYMYFDAAADASMYKLQEEGTTKIETVAIDEDITEPVTFIKMDIEGGEQRALYGCQRHIRATKPKLAISIYHNNVDLFACARIIDEIQPGYSFYMRYSGGNKYPSEYVLLCVYEQ